MLLRNLLIELNVINEEPKRAMSDNDVENFIQKITSSKIYKSAVSPYEQMSPIEKEDSRKSTSTLIVIRMNTPNQPQRKSKAIQFYNGISSETNSLFPKEEGYVVSTSVSDTIVKIVVNGYTYSIKFAKPADETYADTDVKEGLSVFFAYYDKQSEKITINNYKEEVGSLLNFVKVKSNVAGLSNTTYNKCLNYLKGLINAGKTRDMEKFKAFATTVNQNMSHGNTFAAFLENNGNFYVERDSLFEKIRTIGSQISGYPKDKWCPGDIYFIKNGSESEIEKRLSLATKQMSDNKEQALSTINSLFSDKYLERVDKSTPIVAVSLKMAEAQAGKLKSGFDEYADAPKDYSLDKEELSFKIEDFRNKIKDLTDKLKPITKSQDVDIKWEFVNPDTIQDFDILKFKYASYKAVYFILTKIAENRVKDFDEAIVSLTAFGLGVINKSKGFSGNVNPPFFKVVANKDGSYKKPTLFKGGTSLGLINLQDPNSKPKITINDRPTFKGLTFSFGMIVGSENFDILISFRPNGSTQITVELTKASPVE
jgi:hypothetical protein